MAKDPLQEMKEYYLSFSGCDMVATCYIRGINMKPYVLGELSTLSYSIHMDRKPVRSLGNINAKDYTNGPRTIAGTLVFAQFNKHFAENLMNDIKNSSSTSYEILSDEIPPFDITITAANEYGAQSVMALYGVRLVNEGMVVSINDIFTENTYNYFATDIEYFKPKNDSVKNIKTKQNNIIKQSTFAPSFARASNYDGNIGVAYPLAPPELLNIENPEKVSISAYQIYPAIKDKKGRAKIVLNPKQKTGYISIKNKEENKSYKYNIDLFSSEIFVPLYSGDYTIDYFDTNRKLVTTKFDFTIDHYNTEQSTDELLELVNNNNTKPLVNNVTNNSIEITSNVRDHIYAIIYDEEDGSSEKQLLKNRKALFNNLKSDNTYIIYTSNDDSDYDSDRISVRTLIFKNESLISYCNYIKNNYNILKENTSDYIDILEYITTLDKDSSIDAILDIKSQNRDFTEKTKSILDELLYYATIYESDKINYFNSDNKIKQAYFDMLNCENEKVYISDEIENAYIYKYKKDKLDFDTKISKDNIKDNTLKFPMKNDTIYSIVLEDSNKIKSVPKYLYIDSFKNKLDRYNIYKSDIEYKESLINSNLFIPTENKSRDLSIVISQRPYTPMCAKPVIESIDDDGINLYINRVSPAFINSVPKLCICKIEDSLMLNYPIYKKEIVTNNTKLYYKDFFFDKSSKYVIYIERNNNRISEATYFSLDESEIYNIETIISDQFKIFYTNRTENTLTKNTINLLDDIIINNETIVDQFIKKIMNINTSKDNMKEAIIDILKIWITICLKSSTIDISILNKKDTIDILSNEEIFVKYKYFNEIEPKEYIKQGFNTQINKYNHYPFILFYLIDSNMNYINGVGLYDSIENTFNFITGDDE